MIISKSFLLNRQLTYLIITRFIFLLCCDWSSFDIILRTSFSSHCSDCTIFHLLLVVGFLVGVDFTFLSEGLLVLVG